MDAVQLLGTDTIAIFVYEGRFYCTQEGLNLAASGGEHGKTHQACATQAKGPGSGAQIEQIGEPAFARSSVGYLFLVPNDGALLSCCSLTQLDPSLLTESRQCRHVCLTSLCYDGGGLAKQVEFRAAFFTTFDVCCDLGAFRYGQFTEVIIGDLLSQVFTCHQCHLSSASLPRR